MMTFHTSLTTAMREGALHPVFPEGLVGIAESRPPSPLLLHGPRQHTENILINSVLLNLL